MVTTAGLLVPFTHPQTALSKMVEQNDAKREEKGVTNKTIQNVKNSLLEPGAAQCIMTVNVNAVKLCCTDIVQCFLTLGKSLKLQ